MIKGFVGMLVGTTLGGEAMKAAGTLGGGFKEATQTLVGAGTLGYVAGKTQEMFKWKK